MQMEDVITCQPTPDPSGRILFDIGRETVSNVLNNLDQVTIVSYDVSSDEDIEWQYFIKSGGKSLFVGLQDSWKTETFCCIKTLRKFSFKLNHSQNVAFSFTRRRSCYAFCCACCLQKAKVSSATCSNLGIIEQITLNCNTSFVIKDGERNILYYVVGPCRCQSSCKDFEFTILDKESKELSNITTETGRRTGTFLTLTFPKDAVTANKILLIVCTILLMHKYFEMRECLCCSGCCLTRICRV